MKFEELQEELMEHRKEIVDLRLDLNETRTQLNVLSRLVYLIPVVIGILTFVMNYLDVGLR